MGSACRSQIRVFVRGNGLSHQYNPPHNVGEWESPTRLTYIPPNVRALMPPSQGAPRRCGMCPCVPARCTSPFPPPSYGHTWWGTGMANQNLVSATLALKTCPTRLTKTSPPNVPSRPPRSQTFADRTDVGGHDGEMPGAPGELVTVSIDSQDSSRSRWNSFPDQMATA